MKNAKTLAGLLVIIGGAATWGLIGAGLVYMHATETVHDPVQHWNDGHGTLTYHTFHHGAAGTIVLAGIVAACWVILTIGTTLLGGSMIAERDSKWS